MNKVSFYELSVIKDCCKSTGVNMVARQYVINKARETAMFYEQSDTDCWLILHHLQTLIKCVIHRLINVL